MRARDRQPGLRRAGEVGDVDHPVARIVLRRRVRVVDVQRRVGLLGAEVRAGLVVVVVVEVPQQARHRLVHHPVDDAGRRRVGPRRVVDVGLELRPHRLVVERDALLDEVRDVRAVGVQVGRARAGSSGR